MNALNFVRDESEWDQLVEAHDEATIFHSSAWSRVLTETYGHQPLRLELSDETGARMLLPLHEVRSALTGTRGVALPFSDLCPPLYGGEFKGERLVEKLAAVADERKWKYFELRGARFLNGSAPSVARFYGHELDLSCGFNELEQKFSSAVRRNVRKAERSGVEVQITRSGAAVRDFAALLARTRRRHGVPPQSKNFFLNVHKHLLETGKGFVALAQRNKQPIAGAMFFQLGRNAVYKWGASDEREQAFRANNLVMREAIRHLCESGARSLHFGRTAVTNEGLRRFKLAWGAQEEMIDYFRFERESGTWSDAQSDLAERAGAIFRNLPLAANRLIGTLVYPHLD